LYASHVTYFVPPHEVRTIAIIARVINFVIILILRVFKESGCSYTIGRDKETYRERTNTI